MFRPHSLLTWMLFTGCAAGCASFSAPPSGNPLMVRAQSPEAVWEHAVEVLHEYHFEIARENRLNGIIETDYRTGSNVLEPWHPDSVGLENRLESTFQSIRRKALVTVTPTEAGYLVGVQVFKEIEDVPGPVANSAGGATFIENQPLQRDLDQVLGQVRPSGWIPQGRDPSLEQSLLASLQAAMNQ